MLTNVLADSFADALRNVQTGARMLTTARKGGGVRRTGRPRPAVRTTVSITCLSDGRAHAVPDEQIAAAQGRYQALCGHWVTAASLVEPDGAPCPACATAP